VAFTALDLLAGIKASRTAAFGGLDRLAVDHASARAGFVPDLLARGHDQHVVDLGQRAVAGPAVEIPLDRRIGRKLLWHLSPLTTGRGHLEKCLYDRAQIGFARSPITRRTGINGAIKLHSASVMSLA
jgi:hypothetical protein